MYKYNKRPSFFSIWRFFLFHNPSSALVLFFPHTDSSLQSQIMIITIEPYITCADSFFRINASIYVHWFINKLFITQLNIEVSH